MLSRQWFNEHYVIFHFTAVRSPKSILIVDPEVKNVGSMQLTFAKKVCPISECILTLDAGQNRRTFDAVLMISITAKTLENFLPKPKHQVTMCTDNALVRITTCDNNVAHYDKVYMILIAHMKLRR